MTKAKTSSNTAQTTSAPKLVGPVTERKPISTKRLVGALTGRERSVVGSVTGRHPLVTATTAARHGSNGGIERQSVSYRPSKTRLDQRLKPIGKGESWLEGGRCYKVCTNIVISSLMGGMWRFAEILSRCRGVVAE